MTSATTKRPAFQFYPADWKKDVELQGCSIGARGLWLELSCVMHECTPYGHLTLAGGPMPDDKAARLVGVELREYRKLLAELEAAGVPSRTAEGVLYSRRMVRDEETRNKRAAGGSAGAEHGARGASHGSKGGRPRKPQGAEKTPLPNSPKPPPSSSFSTSDATTSRSDLLSNQSPNGDLSGASPPDVPPLEAKEQRTRRLRAEAVLLLAFLNEKTGRKYEPVPANVDPIVARLKEGFEPVIVRQVIARKCRQWGGDEKMDEYLRPKTLFSATNFANYAGEIVPEPEGATS